MCVSVYFHGVCDVVDVQLRVLALTKEKRHARVASKSSNWLCVYYMFMNVYECVWLHAFTSQFVFPRPHTGRVECCGIGRSIWFALQRWDWLNWIACVFARTFPSFAANGVITGVFLHVVRVHITRSTRRLWRTETESHVSHIHFDAEGYDDVPCRVFVLQIEKTLQLCGWLYYSEQRRRCGLDIRERGVTISV